MPAKSGFGYYVVLIVDSLVAEDGVPGEADAGDSQAVGGAIGDSVSCVGGPIQGLNRVTGADQCVRLCDSGGRQQEAFDSGERRTAYMYVQLTHVITTAEWARKGDVALCNGWF